MRVLTTSNSMAVPFLLRRAVLEVAWLLLAAFLAGEGSRQGNLGREADM